MVSGNSSISSTTSTGDHNDDISTGDYDDDASSNNVEATNNDDISISDMVDDAINDAQETVREGKATVAAVGGKRGANAIDSEGMKNGDY